MPGDPCLPARPMETRSLLADLGQLPAPESDPPFDPSRSIIGQLLQPHPILGGLFDRVLGMPPIGMAIDAQLPSSALASVMKVAGPFAAGSIAQEPQSLPARPSDSGATSVAEGIQAGAVLDRSELKKDIVRPAGDAATGVVERERHTLKNLIDDDVAHGSKRRERDQVLPFLPGDAKSGVGGLPTEGDRLKPVLFFQCPGDDDEVSINDIWQGKIGDCFFLGSLAAVVCHDPQRIKDMVVDNGDGTYTVTFKERVLDGFKGVTFKDRAITVTADFPGGQDGKGHVAAADVTPQLTQEIWPLVFEKAYGVYLNEVDPYGALRDGGSTQLALEAITGHVASGDVNFGGGLFGVPTKSFDSLLSDFQSGKAITVGTYDDDATLVPHHCYAVQNVYRDAEGRQWVQLYNPWGNNQPAPMPFDEIRKRMMFIA